MRKRKIIHIGLPKTATTTLQKHFFPKLCMDHNFSFNPPEFLKIKRQRLTYDQADLNALKKVLAEQNILISQEGLIDWNPRNWSKASTRVLDIFGEDATIVITIREPVEYLRSVYIQKIQEGNVVKPHDFFVSSKEYDALEAFLPERSLLQYDYQKLDYEHLKSLYVEKFENVHMVPLSKINTLYPFSELFCLREDEIKNFAKTS